jgi:hypothetical protein
VRDVTSLIQTADCRTPGCIREASFAEGPSAGLCQECAEKLVSSHLEEVTQELRERESPPPPKHRAKATATWTEASVIDALKEWAAQHGHSPTQQQWRKADDGRPVAQTVRNIFGGWDQALEAAGLEPLYPAAVLTITPASEASGDQTREMGRFWAAKISEDPDVDEVRVQTTGTVGKEAGPLRSEQEPPESPPPTPPRQEPEEPFERGMLEGMRATYLELLIERLGQQPVYQDCSPLMDRIERLLGVRLAQRPVKSKVFAPDTDDLRALGAYADVLLAKRDKGWDMVAGSENELEAVLVRMRRVADEWIINELGGPKLGDSADTA